MAGLIQNEDIKSSAELAAGGGTDAQLPNDTKVYITSLSKTLAAAIAAGDLSSGGGGGSFQWGLDSDGNAAVEATEFSQKVFKFQAALAQTVYGVVKVPTSYQVGNPIKIKVDHYTDSTSGNQLLTALASLIRTGTDAAGTTTNQRTSTNAAISSTSPANKIVQATLDITDSTGHINGVVVNPGDEIEVKLSRGTDTDTGEIRLRAYGSDVTFR